MVSFQCNSVVNRGPTCWLCSTTEAYRTLAPLDLDLVQTLSASKAGAHCLQRSSTLLTGLVAQEVTKTGFLSKLSCHKRTDCSGSKLLLSVQPLSGCSVLVHSLSSRLPTADKDRATLACLRLRRRIKSKQDARAELKIEAVALRAGHVMPISLVMVDNVTAGDYTADANVQQCVCAYTDLCSKLCSKVQYSGRFVTFAPLISGGHQLQPAVLQILKHVLGSMHSSFASNELSSGPTTFTEMHRSAFSAALRDKFQLDYLAKLHIPVSPILWCLMRLAALLGVQCLWAGGVGCLGCSLR